MKREHILYLLIGAAALYIYKLRQANTYLADHCGFNDATITISETINQNN